jgi:CRISPR system Cascade subunit CasC
LKDEKLADKVLEAFLKAAIHAIPRAKQNSMAAQNLPSFGMIIVREKGAPCSLANAFARPVRVEPGGDEDLIGRSVAALDRHWNALATVYGTDGIVSQPVFCLEEANRLEHLARYQKTSAAEAVETAVASVTRCAEAAA